MFRLLISIFLPVLFAPHFGAAQTPAVLVEGQRVRVAYRCKVAREHVIDCRESRSSRIDTGHLQALDGDTLRIRVQARNAELAIPTVSVAQLWVVEARKGHFWAGAGIGLVAGALIGGLIGSTVDDDCYCIPELVGVVIGAPGGFILGGVVGAVTKSDRWSAVRLNDQRMSVEPRLDALGLTVSLAF